MVLWIGRRRKDAFEELAAEYRQRLERFASVRDLVLKPAPGEGLERLVAEADSIRGGLPDPCRTVVLDRRGRSESSRAFAVRINRWWEEWPHPLAFVVGSDLGIHPELRMEAHRRWSLGPLTLPHALARVVVYEQLYRAFSIRSGGAYHRSGL
ncbi:MAG: 23S rRNA (pseudouridine(1915)-N(3))-methyltransferase RlmH [Thermoanaerobaculia bacterium]|nr:23S rRNA (pseudouridine(1915)-N(3))-methyltransferase RlmH [Thermoanaerobaculia bacterium]